MPRWVPQRIDNPLPRHPGGDDTSSDACLVDFAEAPDLVQIAIAAKEPQEMALEWFRRRLVIEVVVVPVSLDYAECEPLRLEFE